jgi:hypothetical protein
MMSLSVPNETPVQTARQEVRKLIEDIDLTVSRNMFVLIVLPTGLFISKSAMDQYRTHSCFEKLYTNGWYGHHTLVGESVPPEPRI